jgi:hypothetical protein
LETGLSEAFWRILVCPGRHELAAHAVELDGDVLFFGAQRRQQGGVALAGG